MGVTTVDLYRMGSPNSPRLDNVRLRDVTIFAQGGRDWVRAGAGGVSTLGHPPQNNSGRVWRLPAGTTYPGDLIVVNDHGNHWSWEPLKDMPLDDYKAALATVNGNFL